MPSYKIIDDTFLFEQPDQTSLQLFPLLVGEVVRFPQGRPNDDFISVIFSPEGEVPTPGFILRKKSEEIPDGPPEEVDREGFVRECLIAERSINNLEGTSPWFVLADFLIARALVETKIKDAGSVISGSDGIGPLQVTSAEWKDFLDNGKTLAKEFVLGDRVFPTLQVYGAAYRMHTDAKAISDAKPDDGTPGAIDDLFLPSYLDLFHAHLTDAKTAVAIRKVEADNAKKLGDMVSAEHLTAIAGREQFTGVNASTTVPDFVAKTEGVLTAALKDAFDLIKTFAPEQLPQAAPGKATWLEVAMADKDKVTEQSNPDKVKAYFVATDFGPVGASIPHWCGAFVAHCIKKSGNSDSIPKGSARAANWKTWGQSIPAGSDKIPQGAVVVLTPAPGTNTSGHVGFFVEFQGGRQKVKLLGGNQGSFEGGGVNETPFATSSVAAIRWLETAPVGNGAATGKFNLSAAGVKPEFQQFGDMIVDRFARAGFSPVQQHAALANAIGESGLNPKIKAAGSEQSFGLFQCNRTAGLGRGFTIEQLTDPEVNIGIIIKEAKKFREFKGATTLRAAVDAFVRFVERPRDTEGAISTRMRIAEKLQR